MKKILGLVIGSVALLTIAACQTTPSTQEAVAAGTLTPMTTDEILELVTGKTITYPNGREYHGEGGAFEGVWKGEPVEGTWWVENDVRCYDVEEWGGEWCHDFYWEEDQIVLGRQGEDKLFRDIGLLEGKQL